MFKKYEQCGKLWNILATFTSIPVMFHLPLVATMLICSKIHAVLHLNEIKHWTERTALIFLSLQILFFLQRNIILTVRCHVATHRGVFSQLAKRREGLSVSPADLLHDQTELRRQFVRLHDGHLHRFLLPLPPDSVVSHC